MRRTGTGTPRLWCFFCCRPETSLTETQNDFGRLPPITRRDRAASRTHARPRGIVVGRQGRLDAGARVRSAGRGHRGIVGSRIPPSQGRRSGQCGVLVQPGGEASVPAATGCGVAVHSKNIAEIACCKCNFADRLAQHSHFSNSILARNVPATADQTFEKLFRKSCRH